MNVAPTAGMTSLSNGMISGFLATLPMTAAMAGLKKLLPWTERYPLHPHLVTEGVLRKAGIAQHLTPAQQQLATTAAHFGYGAAAGSLYPAVSSRVGLSTTTMGALYGLALWAVSYGGWTAAVGIMPSPRQQPPGRQALIVAAHAVWGVALAHIAERSARKRAAAPVAAPNSAPID
ncbi:MAG TPA: hypothetical protein VEB21_17860 [Terriglobales bacterium]|nr:hypothetical protein [Terriglobales bacterium]